MTARPLPNDQLASTNDARSLRRRFYARAIPVAWVWFIGVGIVIGLITHRWWLVLPLSAVAALLISAWIVVLGRRAPLR